MPRFARLHLPGSVVHVIARFINGAFRLAGPTERTEYLARVPKALALTDWRIVAYALMSSHVHLATIAGHQPIERFIKSLHGGLAHWLNRRAGALGPVFAERPATIHLPPAHLGRLVAYIHNNPVRAKVAGDARLGLDESPHLDGARPVAVLARRAARDGVVRIRLQSR